MLEGLGEIVAATRNSKKLAEIGRMLEGSGISLLGLDDAGVCPEVDEDAPDFRGNALKKARETAQCTGRAALADDSGLVVDALDGAPGVYSARYSGPEATDSENNKKLFEALKGVPAEKRTARFVCALALVLPSDGSGGVSGDSEYVFEGKVEGRIAEAPMGQSGFGYDPLFIPEGHERSFAQMSGQEKDSMSHRGRALGALARFVLERS